MSESNKHQAPSPMDSAKCGSRCVVIGLGSDVGSEVPGTLHAHKARFGYMLTGTDMRLHAGTQAECTTEPTSDLNFPPGIDQAANSFAAQP